MSELDNLYVTAYLHFSQGCGPFVTKQVDVRRKPHNDNPHKKGPIKTNWQIKYDGKWRQTYVCGRQHSAIVRIGGENVRVQFILGEDK